MYIIIYLDRKVPWLKYPLKRLVLQISAQIFFCTFVITIFTFFIFGIYADASFSEVLPQSLKGIVIALSIMIAGTLIGNSILFFNKWKEAAVQQEKLKVEHLALQYETLKNQVNPHFLFNSLNSLTSLIGNNDDGAIHFVKKLSEVYRYVLEQRDRELAPLDQEIEFVRSYIYLQKIRFGDKLEFRESGTAPFQSRVIPLSIQMLVENAIKHNVISNDEHLKIEIRLLETGICVINNIQPKNTMDRSTGMGIDNIVKRYEYFTDKPVSIKQESGTYCVTLPLIRNDPATREEK
jgi:LytS/YehU family sensor histidine kinase